MDDHAPPAAPLDWPEAMDRADADHEAGRTTDGTAVRIRLREAIAHMERGADPDHPKPR